MKVTIKDVAKKAKVSLTTVSHVINNKPYARISKSTRERVLKVVSELNYKPNIIARGLAIRKSTLVGVLLPDIDSSFYARILQGIENVANKFDYSILLYTTSYNAEKELEVVEILIEKRVDGLIIVPTFTKEDVFWYNELKENRIPFIVIGNYIGDESIYVNQSDGIRLAFEYLIKLGHKDIFYFSGPKGVITADERRRAFKDLVKKNGLEEKCLIVESGFSWKDGYKTTKDILNLKKMPTAILSSCDIAAMGIYKALNEAGYKIPDDISVIGYDNLDICEALSPALTTINQPKYELGEIAAEKLFNLINGKKEEKKVILPELIIRESCKDIRS